MTIGQNTKSRRNKNSSSDRRLAIDFNGNVQFMHEMSGGETELDLTNLTLPNGSGFFSNPSPETIRGLNLASVRERIQLFNGAGKNVEAGLHFDVLGTKIILKGIVAGVGEVFFGEIRNLPRQNVAMFDGIQNQMTGFLGTGETLFNVGFAIPLVNIDTSVDRLGPVEVFREGVLQYLNTLFTVAGPAEDGDYAFVDNGAGEASVIEFNIVGGGSPEVISVKRTAISVDKEDGSLRGEVEVLGGALEKAIDELSIIQSKPKSDFLDFSPTRQQLRQFGDILLGLLDLQVLITSPYSTALFTDFLSATGTDPVLSGLTINFAKWKRDGEDLVYTGNYRTTGGGSNGTGDYLIEIPASLVIDAAKQVIAPTQPQSAYVGDAGLTRSGGTPEDAHVFAFDTTHLGGIGLDSTQFWNAISHEAADAGSGFSFTARVPITGWQSTQTLRDHLVNKGIL